MGEIQRSYIDSFRTFKQDFCFRHDKKIAKSAAKLSSWREALDQEPNALGEEVPGGLGWWIGDREDNRLQPVIGALSQGYEKHPGKNNRGTRYFRSMRLLFEQDDAEDHPQRDAELTECHHITYIPHER
jgi:hypothetical protein